MESPFREFMTGVCVLAAIPMLVLGAVTEAHLIGGLAGCTLLLGITSYYSAKWPPQVILGCLLAALAIGITLGIVQIAIL